MRSRSICERRNQVRDFGSCDVLFSERGTFHQRSSSDCERVLQTAILGPVLISACVFLKLDYSVTEDRGDVAHMWKHGPKEI